MKTKRLMFIAIASAMIGMVSHAGAAEKTKAPDAKSAAESNYSHSWKGYPESAKTPAEAKLLIEREIPKTVRPNEYYTYIIKVTNQSYFKTDNVSIMEKMPDGFELQNAVPAPQKRGNDLKWDLGVMVPDQREIITVTGKVTKTGRFQHTGSARVNFNLDDMLTIMEVTEPLLQIRQRGQVPENVIVGEVFPVSLSVDNVGSATVREAKLEHSFPANMTTKDGAPKISIPLGDVSLGQSKNIDLQLKAVKTGVYDNKFVVVAKDGVSASASIKTSVRQPDLKLSVDAPRMRFVGNFIDYKLKVTNDGDGAAKDMQAQLQVPDGTEFVSANEGGQLDKSNNTVTWHMKSLESKETKELDVQVKAKEIRRVRAMARASAFAASPRQATADTSIEGIAALLLQVNDINDPVPVGETETYVIKVTNQGSLPATNIRISCDLEESMEFRSSTGPTNALVAGSEVTAAAPADGAVEPAAADKALKKGKVITFAPLASLAPGKDAVWRVVIKALKEGDYRFNANVISDQLTRPVNENESTTFYND